MDFISNEGFHETFTRHGIDQFNTARSYRERYVYSALKRIAERG